MSSGAVGTSGTETCDGVRLALEGRRFFGRCDTGVPLPMAATALACALACAAASSGVAPATWAAVVNICLFTSAVNLWGRIDSPPLLPLVDGMGPPAGVPSGPRPSGALRQACASAKAQGSLSHDSCYQRLT